jgi:HSP20 family protein
MFLIRRHVKPQNELGRLQNDMNRMLQGVFGTDGQCWPSLAVRETSDWPKLDVSETDAAVHVSAELPGLKQDEIEIEVLADTLHIRGEKKDERVVEKQNYHSVERTFGRFDRTVPLPAEVDSKNAEATFKDGVLAINLPKLTPVAAQKITVKSVT